MVCQFLRASSCPLFTNQDKESGFVDNCGLGRATNSNVALEKQKQKNPNTKTQATNQARAGDHHRLIPQLLTYREQGQDLAGVPCDISLVVSVYAPGNICLGAKPTCMHSWQAVLRRPAMRSPGSVSIFTLQVFACQQLGLCRSLEKDGNLCLRERLFSDLLPYMGMMEPVAPILPPFSLGEYSEVHRFVRSRSNQTTS